MYQTIILYLQIRLAFYLSPNTLGIRDYYFFHDYLKYKNDYKYKINVPIRRLYGDKEEISQKF